MLTALRMTAGLRAIWGFRLGLKSGKIIRCLLIRKVAVKLDVLLAISSLKCRTVGSVVF